MALRKQRAAPGAYTGDTSEYYNRSLERALNVVFQHLDIRQCFDDKTLKSLRLTSRNFREIVEDIGALTHFKFSLWDSEALSEYTTSPKAIQYVESITLAFDVDIQLGTNFSLQVPPKLKQLTLYVSGKTSDGMEAVLTDTFPHLANFPVFEVATEKSSGNHYTNRPAIPLNSTVSLPHLRKLSLIWPEVTVPAVVLREILIQSLPRLEELTLDFFEVSENEDDMKDIFGTENEEESSTPAVKWPRLQKLSLNLQRKNNTCQLRETYHHVAVAEQLVSAAHHCPMLTHLHIILNINLDVGKRMKAMAATLKKTQAWPFMKNVSGSLLRISSFQKLWPQAKFTP